MEALALRCAGGVQAGVRARADVRARAGVRARASAQVSVRGLVRAKGQLWAAVERGNRQQHQGDRRAEGWLVGAAVVVAQQRDDAAGGR